MSFGFPEPNDEHLYKTINSNNSSLFIIMFTNNLNLFMFMFSNNLILFINKHSNNVDLFTHLFLNQVIDMLNLHFPYAYMDNFKIEGDGRVRPTVSNRRHRVEESDVLHTRGVWPGSHARWSWCSSSSFNFFFFFFVYNDHLFHVKG